MLELETVQLIQQARETKAASEELCDDACRIIEKSKHLEKICAASRLKADLPPTRKSTRAK